MVTLEKIEKAKTLNELKELRIKIVKNLRKYNSLEVIKAWEKKYLWLRYCPSCRRPYKK